MRRSSQKTPLGAPSSPPVAPHPRTHYITRNGYVVRKDALTSAEDAKIRRELHVCPFNPMQRAFGGGGGDKDAGKFKVYRESGRKLYLPKFYGLSTCGPPRGGDDLRDNALYGSFDAVFHGTLRAQQQEVADATIARLEDQGGGILQLRCGFGKTILALYLMAQLRVKALIVVHKEFLLNQWRERIEQFLPTARVGLVQQSVVDTEDKDIVIAMLQSLAMKDYAPTVFADVGLSCFDECHHLGAEVFSRALVKASTRYMLGLSATPDRKDNLRKVFEWHLGTVVAAVDDGSSFHDVQVELSRFEDPRVHDVDLGATIQTRVQPVAGGMIVYREDHPGCRAKLLKHVVESPERMALLEEHVQRLAADPLRRTLVLSERRGHLTELGRRLTAHGIAHGFYWGGEKQSALEDAATQPVILGTFHMASEGMDVPCLNAVILATPKSDVKQSIGRILRKRDHPVSPLIIDIVDERLPCFKRQYYVRSRLYKKSGFQLPGHAATSNDSAVGVASSKGAPSLPQGCAFLDA